jgi:hypothetical protein
MLSCRERAKEERKKKEKGKTKKKTANCCPILSG